MRYEKKSMRGVTLVEIAVVLAIVGLLIGGVLKGTELLKNARVRSVMDEQVGIQVAWDAFIKRYGSIPGDYSEAEYHIPGAGPQRVGATDGSNSGDSFIHELESPIVFQHLTASGLLHCTTCRATTLSAVSVLNSPTNVYGGVMVIYHNKQYARSDAETSITRLALINVLIPTNVLFELDSKLDDGFPGTGSFRFAQYQGNSHRLQNAFRCLTYSDGTPYADGTNELTETDIYRPIRVGEPNPSCASALLL